LKETDVGKSGSPKMAAHCCKWKARSTEVERRLPDGGAVLKYDT
jgi:hypothetical protein